MKKGLITIFFLSFLLGGFFFYQKAQFYDGKMHVIFCDVGEGDGILIRTFDAKNILIDGGPNDSILSCLSNHLPFWDRKLDVVFLSHPHADHLNGLIFVLERYDVTHYISENVENETILEKVRNQVLAEKKLTASYFSKGDRITVTGKTQIKTIWPPKELVDSSLGQAKSRNLDVNGLALAQVLVYGKFKLLLTSDLETPLLDIVSRDAGDITVLKVSHHGSKNGLSKAVLEYTMPELAVISVGENSYGHPTKQTLSLLEDKKIKTLRTDQKGDIKIVTDGNSWVVVN
ncbi:MAG: MBL fold metallo-hydrolase [Candidatus Levyibacteriota bacterium]